jgi:hypothetical protein
MGSLWDDVDAAEGLLPPVFAADAMPPPSAAVGFPNAAKEDKTAVQNFLFPDKEELPDGT